MQFSVFAALCQILAQGTGKTWELSLALTFISILTSTEAGILFGPQLYPSAQSKCLAHGRCLEGIY